MGAWLASLSNWTCWAPTMPQIQKASGVEVLFFETLARVANAPGVSLMNFDRCGS